MRAGIALILLGFGGTAMAADTNFGIRTVDGKVRNDERMGFGKPEPQAQARAVTPAELRPGYLSVPGTASSGGSTERSRNGEASRTPMTRRPTMRGRSAWI